MVSIFSGLLRRSHPLLILKDVTSLTRKRKSSIPLMIENPERSPIVPPMRLSCPSNLTYVDITNYTRNKP